jgi:phosphoribosylformylglycinamidine synthase
MAEENEAVPNSMDILIKASASDFWHKFGQPLITGSVLTFEHRRRKLGFDKVIMQAAELVTERLEQTI